MFDKINGFIGDYNGTKYLELFSSEKYAIFDRNGLKSSITYVDSHNYAKMIQMMICI